MWVLYGGGKAGIQGLQGKENPCQAKRKPGLLEWEDKIGKWEEFEDM
jgi:hypothetical protein